MDSTHADLDDLTLREDPAQARTRRRISGRGPAARGAADGQGQLVLERYRLGERLGAGGFGVVWRARDELLGREVAVKRIELSGAVEGERAGREAIASARLSHPAIVALYEAVQSGDAFYLISELVEGETLAELIREDSLDDVETIEIAAAIAAALAHAHERGVIHRDIKPHNVLVPARRSGPQGAAKLADFGGASIVGEDALTRTGDVLGTLAYMAPEQVDGREVDEQADLYSLALVIYEALSGVNPVRGPTPAATARQIGRRVPPLSALRPDLPRELSGEIDRALQAHPEHRGSIEELLDVLLADLEQLGVPAPAQGAPEEEATVRRASPHPAPLRPHPAPLRPRPAASPPPELEYESAHDEEQPRAPRSTAWLSLPRALWLLAALAVMAWQAAAGRPGAGLLALAALAPLLLVPAERPGGRVGVRWLACALAPALGLAGMASAFPAIGGQASRWRLRGAMGALGYWWLVLADPLSARSLWLGSGAPQRARWEASISLTAQHVIGPLLSARTLALALVWACACVVLPWAARGRSAILDVLLASAWAAALAIACQRVLTLTAAHGAPVTPRGLVLGAVVGAIIAVAARALRGPV